MFLRKYWKWRVGVKWGTICGSQSILLRQVIIDRTQSRLMSESLYWCVHENLTLHRVKKIIFSLYHHKKQIRSFPTMYNTWGCSWGQIGEIIFFLQKSGLKTPILAATVLDHPTSKWAGTHNFKDIANFHRCFKKFGT